MFYKKIGLVLVLSIGIQFPVFAKFENPLLQPGKYPRIEEVNKQFGDKSEPRKMLEQLFCVIMHGGSQLQNGKLLFSLKQGITIARDMLQKRATYSLLDKTVRDIKALRDIAEQRARKHADFNQATFEEDYKNTVKLYVGDACDFIFRGINYINNPLKVQTFAAYLQSDAIPYFIKKKIVWATQRATRIAFERSAYGALVAGAYDIACVLPIIGTELEELPKIILELLYDQCVTATQKLLEKYQAPKNTISSFALQVA